jgi:hypothetical protein
MSEVQGGDAAADRAEPVEPSKPGGSSRGSWRSGAVFIPSMAADDQDAEGSRNGRGRRVIVDLARDTVERIRRSTNVRSTRHA